MTWTIRLSCGLPPKDDPNRLADLTHWLETTSDPASAERPETYCRRIEERAASAFPRWRVTDFELTPRRLRFMLNMPDRDTWRSDQRMPRPVPAEVAVSTAKTVAAWALYTLPPQPGEVWQLPEPVRIEASRGWRSST